MPVTSRPNRARIHSPRGVWEDRGDAAPFTFQHDLAGEPLLQLEAIAELADRLPPELIEMAPGAQPEVVPDFRPATWSAGAGSAGAALLAVEERHQWMVLSNIEHDEAYRRLIEEVAHDFAECAGGTGSAERLEGYVFVTAARSTAPFHVDHEHNIFLQIRGRKRFTTGGFPDDDARGQAFEAMYSGQYGATRFAPVDPTCHELGPGDGLFVPPEAVHGTATDGEISISLSIVFHTPSLDRAARVYAANAHFRRLGLRPRPPGASPTVDRLKSGMVSAWRTTRRLTSR